MWKIHKLERSRRFRLELIIIIAIDVWCLLDEDPSMWYIWQYVVFFVALARYWFHPFRRDWWTFLSVFSVGGYATIFSFILQVNLACLCLGNMERKKQPHLQKCGFWSVYPLWQSENKSAVFWFLLSRLVSAPAPLYGCFNVILFILFFFLCFPCAGWITFGLISYSILTCYKKINC